MLCQRLSGICGIFSSDAQEAYVDDTVMQYVCLILLTMFHKVPCHFFRVHAELWFWTLKAFRYLKFCFCAFLQVSFFLPTVRISLSVLHLRLSGKQSRGMIPRGSGMNAQGHDMIHMVTLFGCGVFSNCCNPGSRGCTCRQAKFLRVPKSMMK